MLSPFAGLKCRCWDSDGFYRVAGGNSEGTEHSERREVETEPGQWNDLKQASDEGAGEGRTDEVSTFAAESALEP